MESTIPLFYYDMLNNKHGNYSKLTLLRSGGSAPIIKDKKNTSDQEVAVAKLQKDVWSYVLEYS